MSLLPAGATTTRALGGDLTKVPITERKAGHTGRCPKRNCRARRAALDSREESDVEKEAVKGGEETEAIHDESELSSIGFSGSDEVTPHSEGQNEMDDRKVVAQDFGTAHLSVRFRRLVDYPSSEESDNDISPMRKRPRIINDAESDNASRALPVASSEPSPEHGEGD